MPCWDQRFQESEKAYPQIEKDQFHIDILTAHFVQHPDRFDVVVASNLFGDILSDLGPAVVGGMGIAGGANINPEGDYPSMFEPVHGSAPDIAGQNKANPIALLLSACLMLDHLNEKDISVKIKSAINKTLEQGKYLTGDLGGSSSTTEITDAIISNL